MGVSALMPALPDAPGPPARRQLRRDLVTVLGLCAGLTALASPSGAKTSSPPVLDHLRRAPRRRQRPARPPARRRQPLRRRARIGSPSSSTSVSRPRSSSTGWRSPSARRRLDRAARLRRLRLPPSRPLQLQPRRARRRQAALRRRPSPRRALPRHAAGLPRLRRPRRAGAQPWLVAAWLVLVGLLMISRLRTPAPKGLRVRRERARWLLVGVALVAGLGVSRLWLLMILLHRRLPRRAPRRRRRQPPPAAAPHRPETDMRPKAVTASYRRWPGLRRELRRRHHDRRPPCRRAVEPPAGRVLEVGVGTGLALSHYAPHLEITGIDFSAEMLAQAPKPRSPPARPSPRSSPSVRMDARALDFPDVEASTPWSPCTSSRSSPSPSASSPRWPASAAPAARS